MTQQARVPTYVILPAHTLLLDVAGPMEVLRKANELQSAVTFDVTYVSPLPAISTSVGLRVTGHAPLPETLPSGALVIVSGNTKRLLIEDAESEALGTGDDEIVDWLRHQIRPDILLVCICSGALLAARAGLLDGRACTTHFENCADLARMAPRARVFNDRLFVEDGNCFTSAGITAGVDLMLHLTARFTDETVSARIARYLVVYMRRDGHDAQISPWVDGRNHIHPAIHRVQDAIAAQPAADWTLEAMAKLAAASPRHLSRLFQQAAGMSAVDFVNRIRLALARDLLLATRLDMETIADRTGFASSRQLRRAWGRIYPQPPSALRRTARDTARRAL